MEEKMKYFHEPIWALDWHENNKFFPQRLPDPHEEISMERFLGLMLHGESLREHAYEPCVTLDWGQGPLIEIPNLQLITVGRFCFTKGNAEAMEGLPVYDAARHLLGTIEAVYFYENSRIAKDVVIKNTRTGKIEWGNPSFTYLIEKYQGYGGWPAGQNMWNTHYYFFDSYGLAACTCAGDMDSKNWLGKKESAVYIEIVASITVGARFFHIGCKHNFAQIMPKNGIVFPFDKTYECLKCKYTYTVNTGD